jgi:hypothetical protein
MQRAMRVLPGAMVTRSPDLRLVSDIDFPIERDDPLIPKTPSAFHPLEQRIAFRRIGSR